MTLFNNHYHSKLSDDIKNCKGCILKKAGLGSVGGLGSLSADVMFVSELPGAEEIRTGIPATGKGKDLFYQCLVNAELSTEDWYFTYLMKCMRGKDLPTRYDFKQCLEFLLQEIDLVKPRIICTMGFYASKYLLEYYKYTDVFNSAIEIHGNGLLIPAVYKRKKIVRPQMYIIPTFNPASDDPVMNSNLLTDVKTISAIRKLSTALFN